MVKLIMRHLPPDMCEEKLREELSPFPDSLHSLVFHPCIVELFDPEYRFNRAYLEFNEREDASLFVSRWNKYVFVDSRGIEYCSQVELAIQQRSSARPRRRKPDPKTATIENDLTYLSFLEDEAAEKEAPPAAECTLDELAIRDAEKAAAGGCDPDIEDTPLVRFAKMSGEAKREHTAIRDQTYCEKFRRRRGINSNSKSGDKLDTNRDKKKKLIRENRGLKVGKINTPASTTKKRDTNLRYFDKQKTVSPSKATTSPTKITSTKMSSAPSQTKRYSSKPTEERTLEEDSSAVKAKTLTDQKKVDRNNRYRDRPTIALYDPSKRSRQIDRKKKDK